MADGTPNPNQVGEASIAVKVDLSAVERDMKAAIERAQKAASVGVNIPVGVQSSGSSPAAAGAGVSAPGGSPIAGRVAVPAGTPPAPSASSSHPPGAQAPTMMTAMGPFPVAAPQISSLPGAMSSIMRSGGSSSGIAVPLGVPSAIATLGAGAAHSALNIESGYMRIQEFQEQTAQAGVDQGFLTGRRARDLDIAGRVAAGVPEFVARGGIGSNQQAIRDTHTDTLRNIDNEYARAKAGLPTPGQVLTDLINPFSFGTNTAETLQKFRIQEQGLRQQRNTENAQFPGMETSARFLDMMLLMKQQSNDFAAMRMEAPR